MKVSDALKSRISTRAFLAREVPRATIETILETAKYAPSGGNLQPWRVWVLAGRELAAFRQLIAERLPISPRGEGSEYHVYPPELAEPYRTRRFKCGEDLYATIAIPREDKAGRLRQFARNFEFFDAPVALFFAIDRGMQQGQWADLGMFIQSIMLLAREHGLATCAQEAWAQWHQTIQSYLAIPPELMLFCGMAMGYPDEAAPINRLRTDRAALSELAVFRGFD